MSKSSSVKKKNTPFDLYPPTFSLSSILPVTMIPHYTLDSRFAAIFSCYQFGLKKIIILIFLILIIFIVYKSKTYSEKFTTTTISEYAAPRDGIPYVFPVDGGSEEKYSVDTSDFTAAPLSLDQISLSTAALTEEQNQTGFAPSSEKKDPPRVPNKVVMSSVSSISTIGAVKNDIDYSGPSESESTQSGPSMGASTQSGLSMRAPVPRVINSADFMGPSERESTQQAPPLPNNAVMSQRNEPIIGDTAASFVASPVDSINTMSLERPNKKDQLKKLTDKLIKIGEKMKNILE